MGGKKREEWKGRSVKMLLKTQLVHIKVTRNLQLQNNYRISQRKNHTNSYNQIVGTIEFITFPFISSKEIFIALSFQLRKSFIIDHVNIRIEFFFFQSGHTKLLERGP